jgi:hypothetical protein
VFGIARNEGDGAVVLRVTSAGIGHKEVWELPVVTPANLKRRLHPPLPHPSTQIDREEEAVGFHFRSCIPRMDYLRAGTCT